MVSEEQVLSPYDFVLADVDLNNDNRSPDFAGYAVLKSKRLYTPALIPYYYNEDGSINPVTKHHIIARRPIEVQAAVAKRFMDGHDLACYAGKTSLYSVDERSRKDWEETQRGLLPGYEAILQNLKNMEVDEMRYPDSENSLRVCGVDFEICPHIIDLLPDKAGFYSHGAQFKGTNPFHGSTTNNNFCIDKENNTWHCFRCGSGGGLLQYIAVLEGFIECHEARPGALRGKLFHQVLKIAQEKYGAVINQKDKPIFSTPLLAEELMNANIPPVEYWVDGIIPKMGKILVSGKSGAGKSILAMNAACAMTSGINEWLGKSVSPCRVLYMDLEIGVSALRERLTKIIREKGLRADRLFVSPVPSLDLEDENTYKALKEFVSENQIDVVIFDPLGFLWRGNENESHTVRKLLSLFNSLIDEFGVSVVLVHHWRKSTDKSKSGGEMSAGSYIIEGWAEAHVSISGSPGSVAFIKQEKFRHGVPFQPFKTKIDENLWLVYQGEFSSVCPVEDVIEAFDSFGQPRVAVKDLAAILPASRRTVDSRIQELVLGHREFNVTTIGNKSYLVRDTSLRQDGF